MGMMETFDQEDQAESIMQQLVQAYIGCGEFLKAKAANEKYRSLTDINHGTAGVKSGRIEEGLVTMKLQSLISEKWQLKKMIARVELDSCVLL